MFNHYASVTSYRILMRGLSAVVTYHSPENRPSTGGICVANHTSPIDVMLLGCDNCYALTGQRQGGMLGLTQRALGRAARHIWFERSAASDRRHVLDRLREHAADPHTLPILIFPEGTCINNTSVMMFKKGSFEVGAPIYPVAIKFDPRFGDAFWNSQQQSWMEYILLMMTSWAIVADVWYLPRMEKLVRTCLCACARAHRSCTAKRRRY
jgi:glycerol-3-phosphate O-acyltransferase 3/4